MICSFCSLLCDREELHLGCQLRSDALHSFHSRERQSSHDQSEPIIRLDDVTKILRQRLLESTSVLLTGRVYCVETARSLLQLARSLRASLDASEHGWAMNYTTALARNGAFTTTLADSRATSRTFIVLDDGSLLNRFPRLPHLLSQSTPGKLDTRTVLLLGSTTETSQDVWRSIFPNTWSVPCAIEGLPNALHQWTSNQALSEANEPHSRWLDDLRASNYTSIVWSPASLSVSHPELWIEELMLWIGSQNEKTRCSSLALSGLDSTFQQVCTWTTGFPGRIHFRDDEPAFEPIESNYATWIERHRNAANASIVCVDESANSTPFLTTKIIETFAGTIVEIHGQRFNANDTYTRVRLPTRMAGIETDATMTRADQVVTAFVPSQFPSDNVWPAPNDWPTPTEWLVRLSS